jgi:hypothetical protein
MKLITSIVLIFFCIVSAEAQTYGAMYRVQFANKNGSPYSVNSPQAFLSQRAIDRRTHQGISITDNDIPVNQTYLDGVSATGAIIFNKSKWFNTAVILVTDTSIIPTIEALSYVSGVEKIKPWLQQKKKKTKERGGNSFDGLLEAGINASIEALESNNNLHQRILLDYGNGFNQANMLGVDYLHGLGYMGEGMVIAVLDAGFYHVDQLSMFDSLHNSARLLGHKDFVNPGNNLFEESTHGMSVLSTMAGNVPGSLVGTAPHASYWLLRSEDASSEYVIEEDNWVAAAEFADSVGADVINSSLGYTRFDDPATSHTYDQMDGNTCRVSRGADIAASKGILVVNSAGNSGNDSWRYISAPADADSILTIGAVDSYGNIAYFSSLGPSADGQVKPTVCAQGQGTFVVSSSDGVYPGNGTSFSSPVMAGAVACLWQANPTFNNMQVIESIKQSSSRYSMPDSMYGYGVPSLVIAHMILSGGEFEQPGNNNSLMANPNPFSEEIDLVMYVSAGMTANIQLSDNNGKIVWSTKNYSLKHGYNYLLVNNLSKLASGVYILRVNSDTWAESTKLIKN